MDKKMICLLIVGIFLASMVTASLVQNKVTSDSLSIKKYTDNSIDSKVIVTENQIILNTVDLPSAFSWMNYGGDWTTYAKDAHCTCQASWVFSAIGAFEAAINIASGWSFTDRDLSEQYVLSCLPAAGNCDYGGSMSDTIRYIKSINPGSIGNSINGVPLECCMPYQAVDYIPCDDKCPDWNIYNYPPHPDDMLWQIEDYGVISINPTDYEGWDLIKTLIYEHGPVAADIYYSTGLNNYWNSHHNPTDVYGGTESGSSNYGIVICGWVDDVSVVNGGYWIIKNSRGASWGYIGFANIAYGCNNLGDEEVVWVEAVQWSDEDRGPGPQPPWREVHADFTYAPENPIAGEEIKFTDSSTGPVVMWEWDFDGDGIWDISGFGSAERNPKLTYDYGGEYTVTQRVWSSAGLNSQLTRIITVNGENVPPGAPEISGDTEIIAGKESTFTFVSADNNGGDTLFYYVDWGDGNIENWVGPYKNKEIVSLNHTYKKGTYTIISKTKDQLQAESQESKFDVKVSKNKATDMNFISDGYMFQLLIKLLSSIFF